MSDMLDYVVGGAMLGAFIGACAGAYEFAKLTIAETSGYTPDILYTYFIRYAVRPMTVLAGSLSGVVVGAIPGLVAGAAGGAIVDGAREGLEAIVSSHKK